VSAPPRDRWAEWLLERRFGGDEAVAERSLEKLRGTRDHVLGRALAGATETLLDVGCGDGLIASWNPLVPTLEEAMEQTLSPGERERLADVWRPQVESGAGIWRMATAHLWAERA
jgi:hypothetical protein